jgi:hypothetical protein
MAFQVADRVKETTTTTGTGTLDLGGAASGFETFVAGIGNGNETYYVITDPNTGDYEVGVGTVTDAATDTLSRDSVISSSNSDSLVNFGAGTKDVFCSLPSERAVIIDDASNVEVTANITATSFDGSGAALTSLNASNVSSGTLDNARLDAQLQDIAGLATTSGKIIQGDGANFVLSAYTIPTSDGTTGQVLTTNGSGAVTFQTPTVGDITAVTAGSGLTGGGTTGDVTLNVGAGTGVTVNADDIAIGQDVATSASPTFAGLTTTGDINFGDNNKANFGAGNDLQIYHDGSNSFIHDNGTGNLSIDATQLQFRNGAQSQTYADFANGGAARLFYGGAVKISTTTSGVSVTGTVVSDGLTVDNGALQTDIQIESDVASNIKMSVSSTDYFRIYTSPSDTQIRNLTANPMIFNTTDTERMRIDSSGNVGIGTSSPSSMNAGANQLVVGNGSTGQGLTIYSSTTTAGSIHFADGTAGDTAYRGQLVYNHNGDYMAMYIATLERMRIDSSGNVGIKNSSPSHTLDISDTSTTAKTLRVGQSSGVSTADATMIISNGGSGNAMLRFDYEGSNTDRARIGITSSGQNLQFFTAGNNERMRIDSSGNVGIGTSSPSSLLHIKGANPEYRIEDNNETGSGNIVFRDSVRETAKISVASGASATYQINMLTTPAFRIDSNNDINFFEDTGTTPKFFWDASAESLGIGTSSPSAKLTVIEDVSRSALTGTGVGQIHISGGATPADNDVSSITFSTNNTTTASSIIGNQLTNNGSNLFFGTSSNYASGVNNTAMFINYAGNVGIGTSSPASKLEVEDSVNGDMHLRINNTNTGSSARTLLLLESDGATGSLYLNGANRVSSGVDEADSMTLTSDASASNGLNINTTSGSMKFYYNYLEKMRINSSGNVGIGTSSPSTALDVNGTVKATAFQGDGSALTNVPAGVSDVNMVVVTTTSTYTPTSGTKFFLVYCTGAGGGGGGSRQDDGSGRVGGGAGGGGGTAIRVYDATEMGATAAITIGSGGTGSAGLSGADGGTGGNTTFNPAGTGTTLTGNGGGGGACARSAGSTSGITGTGGSASGGDVNVKGQSPALNGESVATSGGTNNNVQASQGGNSFWGGGATRLVQAQAGSTNGNNGSQGGGGTGSASNFNTTERTGGTGGNGIVVIMEYQ